MANAKRQEKTIILAHRGYKLPEGADESSLKSIEHHFSQGRGYEIDFNFSQDGHIFFMHDATPKRFTHGLDQQPFVEKNFQEISQIPLEGGWCDADSLVRLIKKYQPPLLAFHFKGSLQNPKNISRVIDFFKSNPDIISRSLIFDLKIETAKKIKQAVPELNLAASVAHQYDIDRYNVCVNGTLYSPEKILSLNKLFSWVWLDEWDRADKDCQEKMFYTPEIVDAFKNNGQKVALVTPELHATSPGLYGGEKHPDADPSRYRARIKQINSLDINAICTDNTDFYTQGGQLI